jgi:predicted tellurium resistance membrane protein TerC
MEHFLSLLQSPEAWISLLTLTFLEIVLGVDNIIFVSIVANKLPIAEQPRARNMGLMLAMVFRIVLLFFIGFIISLKEPLFHIPFILDHETHQPYGMSIKDLILLAGGLFLLAKSVSEIHHKLEGHTEETSGQTTNSLTSVMIQIALVNVVFSFDSILTAIGLTQEIAVMMAAVIISMGIMMAFSGIVSSFINRHPTMQLLALAFLILIGVMLIGESLGQHVSKGYIYFGIFFSLGIEVLNMRYRKKQQPIQLHGVLDDARDEDIEGFMEDDGK